MKTLAFRFVVGFFGACAAVLLYGFYHDYWSPEARLGFQNQQNIQRVRPGMTMPEVAAIMGQPVFVSQLHGWPPKTRHTYQMPPGTSKYCDVEFDRMGRVDYVSRGSE